MIEAVRFDCSSSGVDAGKDFERRYDWGAAIHSSAEKRNENKRLQAFFPPGPLTLIGI